MKHKKNVGATDGFSLIEVLVVIAIIAVLSSLAIAHIGRMNDSADNAAGRRNAQNLASVYAAAQAAGLDFYVKGDEAATIKAVVQGGFVTEEGPLKGAYFSVPNVTVAEQANAAEFLLLDDTSYMLRYTSP